MMQRLTILVIALACPSLLMAQWQNINAGLGNLELRSMFVYMDTLMVGTADGIYRTEDLGTNWSDVSGDIGSRDINDIRGGGGPRVIWAATADGAYFTVDQVSYLDHTSTGLTTTDLNYYWFGDDDVDEHEWAIGTNGGGVFTSQELYGPWTSANVGLSGGGLVIHDFSGYEDDDTDFSVLATDNGLYYSEDEMGSWEARNTGLSGPSLQARRVVALGSATLAATQGGLYLGMNIGASYLPLVPGQRFNTLFFGPAIGLLAFGEGGTHSVDFVNFNSVDMTGVSGGDVTCVAVGLTHVYIGTETGGVYRRPLDQFTDVAEPAPVLAGHSLMPNYPNPFNPSTTIRYTLASSATVELVIHDLRGRTVRTLVDSSQPAGNHQCVFNATGLASGIYLAQLRVQGVPVATQRMLLMR